MDAATEVVLGVVGALVAILGYVDVFLTILHPDRDGPVSRPLSRATWVVCASFARFGGPMRRDLLALAGPIAILVTVFTWSALPILGFALAAWPHLDADFAGGASGFFDALYWSGVTFTTLGYGDVVPVAPAWRFLAVLLALSGFALTSAAIAYLLAVFQGLDQRDNMALRVRADATAAWPGLEIVAGPLLAEGPPGLRGRLEEWADLVRRLHERLYRFQPLAFYLRSHNPDRDPEPMLAAVGDASVVAVLLARHPGYGSLRPAADHLAAAMRELARTAIRHHGTKRHRRALEELHPTDADRALIERVQAALRERGGVEPVLLSREAEDEVLRAAATSRIFLDALDHLTSWRVLAGARNGK